MEYDHKKAAKAGVPEELTLIYRVNSVTKFVPFNMRPLTKEETDRRLSGALPIIGTLDNWRLFVVGKHWYVGGNVNGNFTRVRVCKYEAGIVTGLKCAAILGVTSHNEASARSLIQKQSNLVVILRDYFDMSVEAEIKRNVKHACDPVIVTDPNYLSTIIRIEALEAARIRSKVRAEKKARDLRGRLAMQTFGNRFMESAKKGDTALPENLQREFTTFMCNLAKEGK